MSKTHSLSSNWSQAGTPRGQTVRPGTKLFDALFDAGKNFVVAREGRVEGGAEGNGNVVHAINRAGGVDAVGGDGKGDGGVACSGRILRIKGDGGDRFQGLGGGLAEIRHRVAAAN